MTDSRRTDPLFDLTIFREPGRAERELERVRSRLPASAMAALSHLLPASANPDQALSLLERLCSQCGEGLLALFGQNQTLLHYATAIFGHSYWLGEVLLQSPAIFHQFQKSKEVEYSLDREGFEERFSRFRAGHSEADLSLLLARFKKREYIRIALRDILGIATLGETTAEISALADVLIAAVLEEGERQMRARYGGSQAIPGRHAFSVLSLGKLGGNELNYSSDIDLLYLFSAGDGSFGELSPREYFIRQAQLVTDLLSRATAEGAPFRVDLRLRPQGQEGEPAVALSQMLHYYSDFAQDWELQALIKARYSAGDAALGRQFIRGIHAHVYTAEVNFAAVETAVKSRLKIGAGRKRLPRDRAINAIDVKLDQGGIRDIEFLVQCLQRVYGGEERWLRSAGTLFALQKLNDKDLIGAEEFHELSQAYEFLRTIEHRLQLQRGRQTHELPASREELQVLARSVMRNSACDADEFLQQLRSCMGQVAKIYDQVIGKQRNREKRTERATVASGTRERQFAQLLERIAGDAPGLSQSIARAHWNVHAQRNLQRFLEAAMTTQERYPGLLENQQLMAKAMVLFHTSDYLSEILARNPEMLRTLNTQEQSIEGNPEKWLDVVCISEQAPLRRYFHEASFTIAALDLLEPRPVFASMRESSSLADTTISLALRLVKGDESLAVFALGRLGTEEFDIASDADLLFVRAPDADEDEARLDAERLVAMLSAYTREAPVFAVDARLRPHGGEGDLVVSAGQVERYLAEEAQPWEALSYCKLRFVAGRRDVAASLLPLLWHQIVEAAFRPGFAAAVLEMRERLEKTNRYPNSFKLARGGFYDIDFLASYLMLSHADLAPGNTLERLEYLHAEGYLNGDAFAELREATLLYRTTDHAIRLVTGRARPELPAAEHAREATQRLVAAVLHREADGLPAELRRTQQQVREIFLRMIKA